MVKFDKETDKHQLNIKKSLSNNNPKNLTQKQKNNRKSICFDILERLNEQPGLLDNNLAPCDVYLFLKIKSALKEIYFQFVKEMKKKTIGSTENNLTTGLNNN